MSKIRSNEAVRAQMTEPNICSLYVTHTNKPYSTYIRLLFDRIQQLGFLKMWLLTPLEWLLEKDPNLFISSGPSGSLQDT